LGLGLRVTSFAAAAKLCFAVADGLFSTRLGVRGWGFGFRVKYFGFRVKEFSM